MLHQFKAICLDELQAMPRPHHPAVERLAQRIDKKFQLAADDERLLVEQCTAGFLETNSNVRLPMVGDERQVMVYNEAREFIYETLESYTADLCGVRGCTLDYNALRTMWAFGPKSTYGLKKADMLTKFTNASVTEKCLPHAKAIVLTSLNVFSHNVPLNVVRGSKFSTVPKNATKRRNIAVEPSLNMAVQRAAGTYLEGALRHVGLDIKDQQLFNKRLAWLGSIHDDTATIDCRNASDMISCALVKALLPPEWYALLSACRSEEILIDGRWQKLNMISTMGNGFTFPLMTIIYAAIIVACNRVFNGSKRVWEGKKLRYGVFGDDCVVPRSICEPFLTTMYLWGFDVNFEKSYISGPFRESCGGDYYSGHDITPFYVQALSSEQDVYTAINQVTRWCLKSGIVLRKTMWFLKTLIPSKRRLYVPFYEATTAGIHSPNFSATYEAYQAREVPRQITVGCSEGRYPFLSKAIIDLAILGFVRVRHTDFNLSKRRYFFHLDVSDPLNPVFDYVKLSRECCVSWSHFSYDDIQAHIYNNQVRWHRGTFVRGLTDEQITIWSYLHA